MLFHDRLFIDGPARLTKEGHLVATARVAKANNIQDYMPSELGMAPKADGSPYRIFRSEAEVFAKDAVSSAAHRPVTIDHPKEDVSAANWKTLAVGDTGGEVLRDGDFLRIPIMVMDAKGVKAARTTHQEFSLGYSADLDMTPGKFGDAEYDGSMRDIRVNHLALCGTARGGSELRIVDERPAHLRDDFNPEKTTMKIKIGDAEVDLSDGAAVALAVGTLNANLADSQKQVGTLTGELATAKTTIEARDGEIVVLKQNVADAAITPEKLQALADARAKVITDAKAIAGTALVVDGKTDAEIRKAAVTAKLGDAKAKDMSDAAVEGAFLALVPASADTLRDAITHQPITIGDSRVATEAARKAWLADKENAHRGQAA
jgi:hypothetical protein